MASLSSVLERQEQLLEAAIKAITLRHKQLLNSFEKAWLHYGRQRWNDLTRNFWKLLTKPFRVLFKRATGFVIPMSIEVQFIRSCRKSRPNCSIGVFRHPNCGVGSSLSPHSGLMVLTEKATRNKEAAVKRKLRHLYKRERSFAKIGHWLRRRH